MTEYPDTVPGPAYCSKTASARTSLIWVDPAKGDFTPTSHGPLVAPESDLALAHGDRDSDPIAGLKAELT